MAVVIERALNIAELTTYTNLINIFMVPKTKVNIYEETDPINIKTVRRQENTVFRKLFS